MDAVEKCPFCYSKFRDIRGMVYPPNGDYHGTLCTHAWHLGPNYNPNVLKLTPEDRQFLKETFISAA